MRTSTIAALGVALGKNSGSVVGLDVTGRVILRRRLRREGADQAGSRAPHLRHRNGSLVWRPPSWTGRSKLWT